MSGKIPVLLILLISATTQAVSANIQPLETVCYGDLGCYTTAPPWTSDVRPIPALPEDPAIIDTRFYLFTRSNPTTAYELSASDTLGLYASPFQGTKKTIFLIHGWTHNSNHSWITKSVSELMIVEDANVISVDWAAGAGWPYLRAQANTQVVGAELSKFILFLTSKTILSLTNIHLVGHGLGAHAASYAGHRIYGIGRITGLDPATIYFEGGDVNTRLDAGDAIFVDIIHSDAPYNRHVGLGYQSAQGDVDVYPNNGERQPGCTDTIDDLVNSADQLVTLAGTDTIDSRVCSHMRAAEYFAESINSFCPFSAYTCQSWVSFQNGDCFSACRTQSCTALGYHSSRYQGRGVFYSDTQSSAPFCNVAIHLMLDVYATQTSTRGTINYILIGDIGQTRETELYSGLINGGFILGRTISLPGSNPYRIGHVDAIRLIYNRNGIFDENELIIQRATVQQANITIDAFDTVFSGVVLPNGEYVTIYPVN